MIKLLRVSSKDFAIFNILRNTRPLLVSGLTLFILVSCSSKSEFTDLVYTEDSYRKACEVTRSGKKPSSEHIKYLTYTPQTAEQEGIFFTAAYNPLAMAQLKCAAFVINDKGEQTLAAIGSMTDLKQKEDGSVMIHIFGYTNNPLTQSNDISVRLGVIRDQGGVMSYDTEEDFNITPTNPECFNEGCGFVFQKLVTARVNEADRSIFTRENALQLEIIDTQGKSTNYTFGIPAN